MDSYYTTGTIITIQIFILNFFLTMCLPAVLTFYIDWLKSYASEEIYQYSFRCGSKIISTNQVKCPLTQIILKLMKN